MGVDKGFDLYPPLTESLEHKEAWEKFLKAVEQKYADDPNVSVTEYGIEIQQGEHPRLLNAAHHFRRFSSKVTGSHAGNVMKYLEEVEKLAFRHFGDRIYPWDEYINGSEDTKYGWDEVHAEYKLHWNKVRSHKSVTTGR